MYVSLLGCKFSFLVLSTFWACRPTAFQLSLFLMRSQLSVLLWFPCRWWAVFLCCFKIFPLFLAFGIFTIMYLDVDHGAFIPLEFCWTSWMWRAMFFFTFGEFSVIISLNVSLLLLLSLLLWILQFFGHICACLTSLVLLWSLFQLNLTSGPSFLLLLFFLCMGYTMLFFFFLLHIFFNFVAVVVENWLF